MTTTRSVIARSEATWQSNLKGLAGAIKNYAGIIIAAVMIILSFIKVLTTETGYMSSGKNTLIISHWQMEDGYREGLQQVIDNFIALKKKEGIKVNIIQSVVPFQGYSQWGVTQLVGGKPADIMEMTFSDDYVGKYFYPLDQFTGQTNPYNEGSPVAGLPWKQTFIDGMEGAWNRGLLGYYGVGTCTHTWRIFYNMDLLEKITGSPAPPETFEDWLKQCRQITDYAGMRREVIVPIVVRGFDGGTIRMFYELFSGSMLYNRMDEADLDLDGKATFLEKYNAVTRGEVSWDDEEVKAPLSMLRGLAHYFQKGFTSVDLEQAKFLFLQSRAVYLPEGSWQSKSMFANAPFRLGVFEVPPPAPGSPYGRFYDGNITEVSQRAGGNFGITKKCRNFELALEFLMFITSHEQNTVWNRACEWYPAVRLAETSGVLEKFRPNTGGIPSIGGFYDYFARTQTEFFQQLTTFLIEQDGSGREYTYEKFISELKDSYRRLAGEDSRESLEGVLRGLEFVEFQMTWLDAIGEYCPDDVSRTAGLAGKKKMVLESVIQSELIYNFSSKLCKEMF